MGTYRRFSVFYAPPFGSDLARFGAHWLGWDAEEGREVAHPQIEGIDVAEATATPRKYGFHGTLKPPFRLAPGADLPGLEDALGILSGRIAPFEAPALELRRLGRFLALVPSASSACLAALAAACVQDLDMFRAPPEESELARRRQAGLTAAQEANLARWGYPYVLDEFRFHMTLTGALTDPAKFETALSPFVEPFTRDPIALQQICLFGEAADGRFRIIRRFPLTG